MLRITYSSLFGVLLLFQTTKTDKNISVRYAKTGDTVELSCRFTSLSTTLVWRGPKQLTTYSIYLVINEDLEQKDNIIITKNMTIGNYILRILNFGNENEGLYQCDSVVNGKLTIYKVEVKSADKPYEIDRGNIDQHIYEVELGKPCDVSIEISSFQKPQTLGSTNAGGKLGVWDVQKASEEIFTLFSTLVPERSSHLGRYYFIVRNNIGSYKHYIELKCITDSLQIYIPVASCVMLVCLLLTTVIIVLRKNSFNEKKSVVRDVALRDARPQSVPSVHEYEDVESISSSDSNQSYINHGNANSDNVVKDDNHYIHTIALRMYEDLNPNTRNEMNIYDRRVEYNC